MQTRTSTRRYRQMVFPNLAQIGGDSVTDYEILSIIFKIFMLVIAIVTLFQNKKQNIKKPTCIFADRQVFIICLRENRRLCPNGYKRCPLYLYYNTRFLFLKAARPFLFFKILYEGKYCQDYKYKNSYVNSKT